MSKLENLYGIPVSVHFNLDELLYSAVFNKNSQARIVTFVNPHSYYLIDKFVDYKEILNKFDFVLCDGIGVSKLACNFFNMKVERYSFDDTSLAPRVFDFANNNKLRVGIVGSSNNTYIEFCKKLSDQYNNVCFIPISNGYKDQSEILEILNEQYYDIIVIGMGIPRQEKLAIEIKECNCKVGLVFTCGGFLDQKCLSDKYYPYWINKLNIRFLYRIYKEPRRLWRRYLLEYRNFFKVYINSLLK